MLALRRALDYAVKFSPFGGGAQDSERRKVLPEELLSTNVGKLTCESSAKGGVCDVYIIGTRHNSIESCREVQGVISYLKPEVVFLELCKWRQDVLTDPNPDSEKGKVPTTEEIIQFWRSSDKKFELVPLFALTKAERGRSYENSEFRVAYEEAVKYGGEVILGDRPFDITMKRMWEKMSLWEKIKLPFFSMLEDYIIIKHLKQKLRPENMTFLQRIMPSSYIRKALQDPEFPNKLVKIVESDDFSAPMKEELRKKFPTFHETMFFERDMYMSSELATIASKHSYVVAVVGESHLQGIRKHWKQPIVLKDLLEIPSQKVAGSGACKDTNHLMEAWC